MTWRVTKLDDHCGSCHAVIPALAKVADVDLANERRLRRCQRCGERMFGPAPDVIVEEARHGVVPDGIRHQPSLGFESTAAVSSRISPRVMRGRR